MREMMDVEPKLLHVLDLPQLHSKPPASSLLYALSLLVVKPRSWRSNDPTKQQNTDGLPRVHPDGIPDYLTKIVASPLAWILEDDVKEIIWASASLRLAERSGRTAMPAMERTFSIPLVSAGQVVELLIHEPALTADNLGLKTWAASFLLAKRLRDLDLPSLCPDETSNQHYRVLELGSGTGLVGMAAAAVLGTGVVLTDLPEIEANLLRNVEANRAVMASHGGFATTGTLDWSNPSTLCPTAAVQTLDTLIKSQFAAFDGSRPPLDETSMLPTPPCLTSRMTATIPSSFPIIVAADCIYDSAHPAMLTSTIETWLAHSQSSRVVIELPLRDAYANDLRALQEGMSDIGLILINEGQETGIDDWGGDDDIREVRCWWGVWKRARD